MHFKTPQSLLKLGPRDAICLDEENVFEVFGSNDKGERIKVPPGRHVVLVYRDVIMQNGKKSESGRVFAFLGGAGGKPRLVNEKKDMTKMEMKRKMKMKMKMKKRRGRRRGRVQIVIRERNTEAGRKDVI